jgi:GT2 family glycosyltransferase
MTVPTLKIVIVNRNSGPLLQRCVESLSKARRDGFQLAEVAVIDDASTDGSADNLKADGLPLRVQRRPRSGFGASCNASALEGTADYILLVNTDLFVTQDCIARAVAFLEQPENSRFGILGIQLRYPDGRIAELGRKFPGRLSMFAETLGLHTLIEWRNPHIGEFTPNMTQEVDHTMGAFMLIRGALYRRLRGFDERFFVYYEDLDLSWRASRAGTRSVYYPEVWATHLQNATAKTVWPESVFFSMRSRLILVFKWFGPLWGILFLPVVYVAGPCLRVVASLFRGKFGRAQAELAAWVSLWLNMSFLVIKGPRANWPYE